MTRDTLTPIPPKRSLLALRGGHFRRICGERLTGPSGEVTFCIARCNTEHSHSDGVGAVSPRPALPYFTWDWSY